MTIRKLAITAVTFIALLGPSALGAQYTPFVCDPTGEWRLTSGDIVETPIWFEIDYMIEMFGFCPEAFVNSEIDWKNEGETEQYLVPNNEGLPPGMAWCTFWYITYKDNVINKFYPMHEFTPGYSVVNPDYGWYPADPYHDVNYFLPNWGYGDKAYFENEEDDRPTAEEYITQVLGLIGRQPRTFVVDFDQDTHFDLQLIKESRHKSDKVELAVHLNFGPWDQIAQDAPLEGYFYYYGAQETGGNVLKTTFQLSKIIAHGFIPEVGDTFYIDPESRLGQMGFNPVYFLIYPHDSIDTFCTDVPANFEPVE